MEIFHLLPLLLLINIIDIELDCRKILKEAYTGIVGPAGTINHFSGAIAVFMFYVVVLGFYVGILHYPVLDLLPYSLLIVGLRIVIHPIYFAFRVQVKLTGNKSDWGYLGTTSRTDIFIRWLGFREKNHYIFRVGVLIALSILFFVVRF